MNYDSIFYKNDNWQTSACLNFQKDMSHGYIYGYKKAADALVSKLIKDRSDIDYLVYPVVFLYRHHVELLLKKLIDLNITLHDSDDKIPTNHKIKDLWPKVKGYYRKLNDRRNQAEIKFIDQIMDELCMIDPDSMNFRYSKTKDGQLPNENLKRINIEVFSQIIGKVSDFLETFEYQLNSEIEIKWEYLADQL